MPKNRDKINHIPSFMKGRQVFVKCKVNPYVFDQNYLKYDGKFGESIITHKA